MDIPATIYVAFGAVAAALIAGFFSFLNLISSKENKVSEFRQQWINGLHEEIALYTASLQMVTRFLSVIDEYENRKKYYEETKGIYLDVTGTLTKIQLRINPVHAKENPNSHEARLLNAIHQARDMMNSNDFIGAFEQSSVIRNVAAPFLKDEWERVKNGEARYQQIRDSAQRIIRYGIKILLVFTIASIMLFALHAKS